MADIERSTAYIDSDDDSMTGSHSAPLMVDENDSTRLLSKVPSDDDPASACDAAGPQTNMERRAIFCESHWLLKKIFPPGGFSELRDLLKLVWPVVVTFLLLQLINIISVLFVGHLGAEELDAASLANMFCNITGWATIVGLATAVDTLASQAFGANNKRRVGVVLQMGILILGGWTLVVFAIWINAEAILLGLGQDPVVSRLAGQFSRVLVFKLPSDLIFTLLQRYLQAQSLVTPTIVAGLVANALNPLFHYLLMHTFKLGFIGAPIAICLSSWTLLGSLLVYMRWYRIAYDTWYGWSRESLLHWGTFVRLALPGMMMVCIEWWSFEVCTLLSGLLGTIQLGAQAVILQVATISFMLPLGVSVAASIRVGNKLGAGDASGAKLTSRMSLTLILFCLIFSVTTVLATKDVVSYLFTSSTEIAELAARLLPIAACFQIFDFTQGVSSGVLRGAGRQKIGAVFNAICYDVIGLPLGVFLTFGPAKMDIFGLWTGLTVGLALQCVLMVSFLMRLDWEKEAKVAKERSGAESEGSGEEHTDDIEMNSLGKQKSVGGDEEDDEADDDAVRLVEGEATSAANILGPSEGSRDEVAAAVRVSDLDVNGTGEGDEAILMDRKRFRRLLVHRSIYFLVCLSLAVAGGICAIALPVDHSLLDAPLTNMTLSVNATATFVVPTPTPGIV